MSESLHWQVPLEHSVFKGHFPSTPIFPGVLLLDIVLRKLAADGVAIGACEIRSAKFLSPARPGEHLTLRHEASGNKLIRFEIACGTRKIATGDIVIEQA